MIDPVPRDSRGPATVDLILPAAAATGAVGAALARALPRAAPAGAVLYLDGELGAGKTTCARSLLRTLGVAGGIRSPTYTLMEIYEAGAATCIHVDLYRMHSALEVDELDLRQYRNAGHLLLIEWPERGAGALPAADLALQLAYHESGRTARLLASNGLGLGWLAHLANDSSLTPYVSHLT